MAGLTSVNSPSLETPAETGPLTRPFSEAGKRYAVPIRNTASYKVLVVHFVMTGTRTEL